MGKDDDLIATIAFAAAAFLAAAFIASLLSQSSTAQRQNPEYLRQQLIR